MSAPANQQGCKITLYWLDKSRAQRIMWLLEELKLDYELKVFKRGKDWLAPKELKDIHALGKAPVVEIQAPGAEKSIVLAESGAIIEYIAEHFGSHLIPKRYPEGKEGHVGAETEEWIKYRYLMHYTEGSLMSILVVGLLMLGLRKAPVWFFLKPIIRGIADQLDNSFTKPNLKDHMTFLEDYLKQSPNGGEFFCGSNLSAADIMIIFALEGCTNMVPLNETNYPTLYSWVRRMQARDAYKRAGDKVTELTGEKYVPMSDMKL